MIIGRSRLICLVVLGLIHGYGGKFGILPLIVQRIVTEVDFIIRFCEENFCETCKARYKVTILK